MTKVIKYSVSAWILVVLVIGLGYTRQIAIFADGVTKNTVPLTTTVVLKWKGTTLSPKGILSNGQTMIPVTVLRDQLGLSLSYNPGTRTYSVGSGFRQLNMDVSEYGVNTNINNYYVNEYEVKNIGGSLYIPFKLMNDYLGIQGVWNPSLKSLDLTPRVENEIVIITESIETKTKDAIFLLRSPSIGGLKNKEVEKKINAVLEEHKNQFIEASKKEAEKRDSSIESTYQYFQNYVVTYNENNMLSLVMDQYSYIGGTHDGTIRTGLTFSLQDGKLISLDDLLKEKSPDYKIRLDEFVLKNLKGTEGYYGAFKGLNANADYFLKSDGLALFFLQYEYTPFAAGIPTFVIPFNQMLPKGTSLFE